MSDRYTSKIAILNRVYDDLRDTLAWLKNAPPEYEDGSKKEEFIGVLENFLSYTLTLTAKEDLKNGDIDSHYEIVKMFVNKLSERTYMITQKLINGTWGIDSGVRDGDWAVTAKGSGVGGIISGIISGSIGEVVNFQKDLSSYQMDFTIEETGEKFSYKFTDFSEEGFGFKLGAGVYLKFITATGTFMGKKPSQDDIIKSFEGLVTSVGISVLWFGISGFKTENWIVNTGSLGVSKGFPFSIGSDQSETTQKREKNE